MYTEDISGPDEYTCHFGWRLQCHSVKGRALGFRVYETRHALCRADKGDDRDTTAGQRHH